MTLFDLIKDRLPKNKSIPKDCRTQIDSDITDEILLENKINNKWRKILKGIDMGELLDKTKLYYVINQISNTTEIHDIITALKQSDIWKTKE